VASKDKLTFLEACKELGIPEDELEQLVANGEIPCTKDGEKLIFNADVISQFKKTRKTEPTIILTEEEMNILDGMEGMLEEKPAAAAPAAPEKEKKAPAPIIPELDGMEEIVIEPRGSEKKQPEEAAASNEDTVLNLDGLLEDDGTEGTTPIPGTEAGARAVEETSDITVEGNVTDDTLLDTDLLEVGEEEDAFKLESTATTDEALTESVESTLLRGGGARAMAMKRKKSHGGFTAMLVLTAAIFLAPVGVTLNTLFSSGQVQIGDPDKNWVNKANAYGGGMVNTIADLFAK